MLQKWNSAYRLVGDASTDLVYERHIADSLAVLPHVRECRFMIDLGCGAGLPGIPLHIAHGHLETILVDSLQKRMNFCKAVRRDLGLNSLRIQCGRVEDRGVYESLPSCGEGGVLISRATWNLKTYIPMAMHYVRPGSLIIAMKGVGWEDELRELDAGGGFHDLVGGVEVVPYGLPVSGRDRFLLIFNVS